MLNKSTYLFLLLLLAFGSLSSQDVADTIRKTAIDCKALVLPNEPLYAFLKNFKCICIGEMHGTKEPAEFLVYLAKLFSEKERTIVLGIELPKTGMSLFLEKSDSLNLSRSDFFSTKSTDGRSNEAWFKAIQTCSQLHVRFCFFEAASDSLMYDNLITSYKADTNCVILTLSGNVHAKLLPYKDIKTMGCYLKEHFGNKIFTINHIYNEGTMYNRTSEGFSLRSVEPANGVFASSTKYSNYLIANIFNNTNGYSGYYYTKRVTASFPFKK